MKGVPDAFVRDLEFLDSFVQRRDCRGFEDSVFNGNISPLLHSYQ